MLSRTIMRLGWPATAALLAAIISVPAFAVADRSPTTAKQSAKAKKKDLRGPRGRRGPRGLQGPQGRSGTPGAGGATGPMGFKGDKGERGDQKTKVFNIAMSAGDPDVTVLEYAPFTVIARCAVSGPAVVADLLIKTGTDDAYLDTSGPGGQATPDFDTTADLRTLARVSDPAATPVAHNAGTWAAASPQGAGITGHASIGTNAYAPGGGTPKACVFVGATTTT